MAFAVKSAIPKTAAIIVAAGNGSRFGGDIPKQFRVVRGKPILRWSVETFAQDERFSNIIIVHGGDQADQAQSALSDIARLSFVEGGTTRRLSVQNGLRHLAALPSPPERVFIHDAARPFLPTQVIDALFEALNDTPGAVPALPVADTMVKGDTDHVGEVVPRDGLYRVQTPQAFHFASIWQAHNGWADIDATDDAQMLRAGGGKVAIVAGSRALEKITFAEDLTMADKDNPAPVRAAVGMGYDVHRLVTGKPLWLGGIEIAHNKGLSGHSDADVALHALTDAILGALAEGDIGQHFPPSDDKWRGAPSHQFLAFARERVEVRGGTIQSVDLTIICEAPKIGPHRDAMRTSIADILQLPTDRISVKATTTEGLGFAGRGEGIAAQAVATLALP